MSDGGESVHLEYGIRNGTNDSRIPNMSKSKQLVHNTEIARNSPSLLPQNKYFPFTHTQWITPNLRFLTLPDFEYHYFSVPNRPPSKLKSGCRRCRHSAVSPSSINSWRDHMSRCRVIVELLCIRPTHITELDLMRTRRRAAYLFAD